MIYTYIYIYIYMVIPTATSELVRLPGRGKLGSREFVGIHMYVYVCIYI